MHAFSLISGLLDIVIADTYEPAHRFERVNALKLSFGRLCCIDPGALKFVFEIQPKGTKAEEAQVSAVMICGCHIGDCHYQSGNEKAKSRAAARNLMLEDFGIEPERFRLEWVSAAEGPRFAQVVSEFTEQVRMLGPNPNKM
jgi:Zn finger protein HypA/HybF involved in hydrogenase expression